MTTNTPIQANDAPAPISPDEFRTGDATALYRRLRPDQRAAIGLEFLRMLRLVGDPQAATLGGGSFSATDTARTDTSVTERLMQHEPQAAPIISAEQTAQVHRYVQEHHPDLFEQTLNHPVTQASLARPGAEPEEIKEQQVKLPQADVPHTTTMLDQPAP